jgi:heptosyltransferase-2
MRILIVKIGAIGDVVMAMNMLGQGHEITWVCGKTVAPLLRGLTELIEVDEKRLLTGKWKVVALVALWWKLLGRSFDLVITAHPDPRYQWITKFVRAKERKVWKPSGRYHGDEYRELLAGALPKVEGRPFDLGRPYVVIAPGGARNLLAESPHRRWPIERYAELMRKLPITVVVTGSESDAWVRDHLPEGYVDLIGKTDLLDLLGVLQKAKALITHDSGPLHLAKLARCPVIALFGPTNPTQFAGPGVNVLWGGEGLPCRPCYDGKKFAQCAHFSCMRAISVERVLELFFKMFV